MSHYPEIYRSQVLWWDYPGEVHLVDAYSKQYIGLFPIGEIIHDGNRHGIPRLEKGTAILLRYIDNNKFSVTGGNVQHATIGDFSGMLFVPD